MEHVKCNLSDDPTNPLSDFRTRNWVEINDESRETHNISNQNQI